MARARVRVRARARARVLAGGLLLARDLPKRLVVPESYPSLLFMNRYSDGLNRASVWDEAVTEDMVLDEQLLRDVVSSEWQGTIT